jgi:hypothetical protein
MSENLIRKIVSSLFFAISIFLMWQIFKENTLNTENNRILILYGVLFISVSILFVSAFTIRKEAVFQNRIIHEEEKEITDSVENIKSETEEKLNNIFASLKRGSLKRSFPEEVLILMAKEFFIVQGLIYIKNKTGFKVNARYAIAENKEFEEFSEGQGIHGQVAKDKKIKIMEEIPEDYIQVVSGLGAGYPENLIFIPIIYENETVALIEAASFDKFPNDLEQYHPLLNNVLAENFKLIRNGK